MTYSHSPTDPLVVLATTANNLMQQYESKTITLDEFKTAINSQLVNQFASVDKSSHNDDAYYTITTTIAYRNAVE